VLSAYLHNVQLSLAALYPKNAANRRCYGGRSRQSASHMLANVSSCESKPASDVRQVIAWTVSIDQAVQLA
jgi:hypothetical protein